MRPAARCRPTAGQVFAAQPAIVAGAHGIGRKTDLIAARLHIHEFLWHHGVAAIGHDRAGHDAHRLGPVGAASARIAGVGRADDLQNHVAAGCQRRALEGVAVHRRVVVGGHVDGRDHVLGQHAVERRANRQLLGATHRLDHLGR